MPRYIRCYASRSYFTLNVKYADGNFDLFFETFRFINLMMRVVLDQNAIDPAEVVHLMSFLQIFQGPKGTSN